MKRLAAGLLALMVLFAPAISAAEIPDPNGVGSVTFKMEFDDQSLSGGCLEVTRVAAVVNGADGPRFEALAGFEALEQALGDPNDPALAEQALALAGEEKAEFISQPIENGQAVFGELVSGIYLVRQRAEDACPGFAPLQPFLVSLPQWQNGEYVYDLTLKPKVGLEAAPTEPSEPTEPTEPPDPELPYTGQLNWPIPLLCVAGLALFVVGFYLCFGKRRDNEA